MYCNSSVTNGANNPTQYLTYLGRTMLKGSMVCLDPNANNQFVPYVGDALGSAKDATLIGNALSLMDQSASAVVAQYNAPFTVTNIAYLGSPVANYTKEAVKYMTNDNAFNKIMQRTNSVY